MIRFILLLFSLFCLSFTNQQPGKDKESFVEIKGKKQYYQSKGVGSPAVIFVSGLGPTMDDFFRIQNKIAKTTKVLCYDRAGIGKSEPLNNERNLENISDELKELLDKVGLNKPCVLVGHSRGGLIVRYFANKYPERVCGLILIDPAIPELRWKKRMLRTEKEKMEFDKYHNSFCTDSTKYSATIRSEFSAPDSAFISGKNFPLNIPTTIIASAKITKEKYSEEDNEIKTELLKNYLKTAPQIKLIFTDKSGHFIHEEEPGLVIDEILLMLKKLTP
ncbi:MAG TPA: alpha/beta hydrolase [Bacteroidia bacterium]|nr:alpha/beta hydrolase [Bacteroidia bacterium]